MTSDTGNWQLLEKIHRRIVNLGKQQQRLYSERSQAIAHRATTATLLMTENAEFIAKIQGIESELHTLWIEKRFVLSQLKGSYQWSWVGPRIDL